VTIVVFTGPTLAHDDARRVLDADVRPPAAQGDVYRAATGRPAAIGIIDGAFARTPSVAHKEILWAMAHGVHVFGSASMGALRAVELAPFGMVGIGAVVDAFARGEIDADDEVAVVHAPAEDGYRALSTALVDIRATLDAATAAGAIGEATRQALVRLAKELFYADRTYPALLGRAGAAGVPRAEVEALRTFLATGRIDQKRADAIAMLEHMRAHRAELGLPKRVRYAFSHTDAWEHVKKRVAASR